ncbi:MAG: hypothetical protein FJ194_14350 [Gammaproteobacteria bacterium]|nr:hypothetical protein [Gammaproteobacteria bacterium]
MKRYFYSGDDLDRIEALSRQLESAGFDRVQMHVLSKDDTGVDSHQGIHAVASIMKKDLLASGLRGAMVGAAFALVVVLVALQTHAFTTPAGTVIALFLAIGGFGFCTWEGGLFGIQTSNRRFARFQSLLDSGQHLFFIDVDRAQTAALRRVVESQPGIQSLGESRGLPRWWVKSQREVPRFLTQTLP